MAVRNPFEHPLSGTLYSRGRPNYHAGLLSLVRERLPWSWPIDLALDIGCGTGQSAAALRDLAGTVLGIDPSFVMLSRAPQVAGVHYLRGAAEAIPVREGSASLVTCGAAFHWFRAEPFFAEVRRVLRPEGRLVVYDNFFSAREGDLLEWYREAFLRRFPKPPRHPEFSASIAEKAGFRVRGPETSDNELMMTLDGLADYLLTQSNVLASFARETGSAAEAEAWLKIELARFFAAVPERPIKFTGPVWFVE